MKRLNKYDHANSLKICNEKNRDLTDDEKLILNAIAGSYATNEPVDKDVFDEYNRLYFRYQIELNLD